MWHKRPVVFPSRLTADEAAARLEQGLSKKGTWHQPSRSGLDPDPSRLVLGEVAGRQVRIYARRPLQRQSWRAFLRGELTPTPTGSELIGTFSYPAFVRVFMALWLSVVLGGALCAATTGVILLAEGNSNDGRPSLTIATILTGMFAFGLLIMTIGNSHGRADEKYLRAWVGRAIEPMEAM